MKLLLCKIFKYLYFYLFDFWRFLVTRGTKYNRSFSINFLKIRFRVPIVVLPQLTTFKQSQASKSKQPSKSSRPIKGIMAMVSKYKMILLFLVWILVSLFLKRATL